MGKRIIQQRRGRGGPAYRVRRKAYKFRLKYPSARGEGEIIRLIHSAGHTAPLAMVRLKEEMNKSGKMKEKKTEDFFIPACRNMFQGQIIKVGIGEANEGNILCLKDVPVGKHVYHMEIKPGDGGKLIRSSGSFAVVTKKQEGKVAVLLPSKKEKLFDEKCRAVVGVISGFGRLEKPIVKAGRKYYLMKSKGKLWPRTSAVKMNVIDHPFGSGRGKNIAHGKKGKIPKLNAPPGAKVGSLRPKRTGRRKK